MVEMRGFRGLWLAALLVTVPVPFVTVTGLSISSKNNDFSSPTERECTQRRLGHIAKTCWSRGSGADQLKITLAFAAASVNFLAELPATMVSPARDFCNLSSCGGAGSPRTRIVSFFMMVETFHHN